MRYNKYGNTGKLVSAVGFGGMRFDMERSMEENADLVRYAFDRGINYFDTAPGYFDGKSEEIFGMAFRDMPRDRFYVTDKLMPTSVNDAALAREKVEQSLERLRLDRIDFFHVWCLRKMEHYHMAMRPGGLYEGLLKCKADGLIGHIVFSSHQEGNEVRRVIETGSFEGVLLGMNILNFPFRLDGAKAAKEHGCGVAVMNPLAGGEIPKNADKFKFLCRAGETPVEAALRFAVANPYIDVALNGFTTRGHIDDACRVEAAAEPVTEAEFERISALITANMNAICTFCNYCRDCPKHIPVGAYMQYYNNRILFGSTDQEMKQGLAFQHDWGILAKTEVRSDACVACGRCEDECTQHLPIMERLREFARWERELKAEKSPEEKK